MSTRPAALLVAALATLSACASQGANEEDQRRLDRLVEDPITTAVVPGLEPTSEISTQLAESSSAVLGGPETANVVRQTFQFAEPPADDDLQEATLSFAAALSEAGWSAVTASCIRTAEGPTDVRLRASRTLDGYVERALVAFEPYSSERWTVVVSLAAPRHDESGDQVERGNGLDCVEQATVE